LEHQSLPAELIGYVDDLRRPLIQINVVGLSDSTLSLVDTGFNDFILIPIDLAFDAGLDVVDAQIWVSLSAGQRTKVFICDGTIEWFGASLDVEMLVSLNKSSNIEEGAPKLSIGTGLLNGCLLEIDFSERKLSIRKQ
jgi:predicted aspartyl protease